MKKIIVLFSYIAMVLVIPSCIQDDYMMDKDNLAIDTSEGTNNIEGLSSYDSEQMKRIAEILADMDLSQEIIQEVHNSVTTGLKKGLEEAYFFKEILSEDPQNNIITRSSSEKLGTRLREYIQKTRVIGNEDADDVDLYAMENSNLQIYWPYSEDWDGYTKPIVTYFPEDPNQDWNYAFYKTSDGIQSIRVDELYMMNKPVWVINESDIPYSQLGNFLSSFDNISGTLTPKNPVNPNSGNSTSDTNLLINPGIQISPVYTTYVGKFMSTKNYDNIFAGGSEFVIQAGSTSNFHITDPAQLVSLNPNVSYLKITYSRSDVKHKRWKEFNYSCPIVTNWYPELNNIALLILEEDQGGTRKWEASLNLVIDNKNYSLSCSIPYGSGDDLIYKQTFDRSFILSSNNKDQEGNWIEYTSGGVHWTMPYRVSQAVTIR